MDYYLAIKSSEWNTDTYYNVGVSWKPYGVWKKPGIKNPDGKWLHLCEWTETEESIK